MEGKGRGRGRGGVGLMNDGRITLRISRLVEEPTNKVQFTNEKGIMWLEKKQKSTQKEKKDIKTLIPVYEEKETKTIPTNA